MRPLIQYDLDEPPTAPAQSLGSSVPRQTRRPPGKRRKRNPPKSQGFSAREAPLQHWDDPGSATVGMVYDEQEGGATTSLPAGSNSMSHADDVEENEEHDEEPAPEGDDAVDADAEVEHEEEEEESRALTHEEIWDDAALIDAWNSAMAEYEAYHGTSKAWKTEPVKKSPLWYNKPYTAPTPQPGPSKRKKEHVDSELEPDTIPLDFDTFVPTYDPSLNTGTEPAPFLVPPTSTMTVSRDEAFNNALSAVYWSGYWTAVYHCRSQSSGQDGNVIAGATEEDEIKVDEDEGLVPAQR